jgi:hypothetical protein
LRPIFNFGNSQSNTTNRFDRIDDVVMGGISTSMLRQQDGEAFARWSGVCREDGGYVRLIVIVIAAAVLEIVVVVVVVVVSFFSVWLIFEMRFLIGLLLHTHTHTHTFCSFPNTHTYMTTSTMQIGFYCSKVDFVAFVPCRLKSH